MDETQIKQIIERQPLHGTALLDPRCKILLLVCIGFVSYFLAGEVVSLALMLVYGLFIALGNGGKWAAKMIITYIVVAYLNALLRYVQVPVLSVIMSVFGVTVLKLIYNNISIGKPDATEEEVYAAAKKARCYDFIMALPDGFQTVVGEGGATLSGGEKQRISIARCILKDAPIIILDEATASVDTDNESYIQEAISELVKGKTLLVIAHRLNTIQNADQILVIDNGQIAQQGTHEELLKQPGIYQEFVNIRKNAAGWSLA